MSDNIVIIMIIATTFLLGWPRHTDEWKLLWTSRPHNTRTSVENSYATRVCIIVIISIIVIICLMIIVTLKSQYHPTLCCSYCALEWSAVLVLLTCKQEISSPSHSRVSTYIVYVCIVNYYQSTRTLVIAPKQFLHGFFALGCCDVENFVAVFGVGDSGNQFWKTSVLMLLHTALFK